MSEKLLVELSDSVELYLYEGILKQNNIPYIIKRPGVRSYMHIIGGDALLVPAEIHVREEDFDRAKEFTAIVDMEKSENPMKKDSDGYKRRKIFAWGIVAIFILPFIILAISKLFNK